MTHPKNQVSLCMQVPTMCRPPTRGRMYLPAETNPGPRTPLQRIGRSGPCAFCSRVSSLTAEQFPLCLVSASTPFHLPWQPSFPLLEVGLTVRLEPPFRARPRSSLNNATSSPARPRSGRRAGSRQVVGFKTHEDKTILRKCHFSNRPWACLSGAQRTITA